MSHGRFKIYQLYDTVSEPWLAEAIEIFNSWDLNKEYRSEPDGTFVPSAPQNIVFNIFGFLPIDYNQFENIASFQRCSLCNQAYHGGRTHDSSVVVLHCSDRHRFHLGCIFQYWDQEGKYLQDCPECAFTPELSHKRVGIEPGNERRFFDAADPTFVHNVYNYNPRVRAAQWMAEQPVTPANSESVYRARKKLYDLPPPGTIDPDARRLAATDDMSIYWLRENMSALAYTGGSVRWRRFSSRDGRLLWMNEDGTMDDEQLGWNRNVARVTTRFWERFPAYEDVDEEPTVVPPSRWTVAEEAAYLRMKRRRRDRNRRERIKASNTGLGSLGRTFGG